MCFYCGSPSCQGGCQANAQQQGLSAYAQAQAADQIMQQGAQQFQNAQGWAGPMTGPNGLGAFIQSVQPMDWFARQVCHIECSRDLAAAFKRFQHFIYDRHVKKNGGFLTAEMLEELVSSALMKLMSDYQHQIEQEEMREQLPKLTYLEVIQLHEEAVRDE